MDENTAQSFLSQEGVEVLGTVVANAINKKANIDSPNLTGNPTAPTQALTDISNKIATTKYVHDALGNTILITINPALSGVVATVTNKETTTAYSGTSNELGQISLTVKEYGTYTIEYNNPNIKSINEIVVSAPGIMHTISAVYAVKATYTLKIDLANSNPLTACEYLDAAYGMTKGSNDWDSKSIFNEIRPCVFQNGKVKYYLDPNNFNHKLDGTAANLTGKDGDVMIEFGKFAYRIYTDKTENCMYVSITNSPEIVAEDNRYHYYAFTRETEGDLEHFYWGAFKGSLDADNKLRSIAGATPANSATIGNFTKYANNNGNNYTISNYPQLVALQCLYLIKYGNLNSQTALGNGYVGAPAATKTGQTLEKGMYYGTTSNQTTQVKFAGIEDFWGNIWEWVNGLTTDSSRNIITKMGGQTHTTPSGLTTNSSGYITKVIGTTEGGFMNIKHGGSQTTYFCDGGYLYAGCVLKFGGRWNDGANAGVFFLHARNAASDASTYVGARLCYF